MFLRVTVHLTLTAFICLDKKYRMHFFLFQRTSVSLKYVNQLHFSEFLKERATRFLITILAPNIAELRQKDLLEMKRFRKMIISKNGKKGK